jgi:hypothetical protein
MQPLSLRLNIAARHLADRLYPTGFDVGPDAPDTFEALTAHVAETGRMKVWNGASGQTVFGDPETNFAFRAWHDWAHWRYALPFTMAGEIAAAHVQAAHIVRLYGNDDETVEAVALLLCEVIGQADCAAKTGRFPIDQAGFARKHVGQFRGYAANFAARTWTDEQAIQAAHSFCAVFGMLNPAPQLAA